MWRNHVLGCILSLMAGLTFSAIAQEHAKSPLSPSAPAPEQDSAKASASTHTSAITKGTPDAAEQRAQRLEGEKRFRANCGRCHQTPHKFPPRVMAAAIRHMRVRAMITDEDMRLILRYMTQ